VALLLQILRLPVVHHVFEDVFVVVFVHQLLYFLLLQLYFLFSFDLFLQYFAVFVPYFHCLSLNYITLYFVILLIFDVFLHYLFYQTCFSEIHVCQASLVFLLHNRIQLDVATTLKLVEAVEDCIDY